jgi:hypothetical protein
MPRKTKKVAAAPSHNQRERESMQLALIEGERSGVSERTVSAIARQAKRRLQRAQV